MSEIITSNSTEGIHFVLNDSNFISELVFDPLESSSKNSDDIIYTDTSQGQLCLIDGNMEAVVLQEGDDLNHYYIDTETLEVKSEPFLEEETALNQQEVLQIVDEEGNIADIVYVDKDVDLSQYQLVDSIPSIKEEDISEPRIINMDELMDGSYETSAVLENFTDENGFQYAFVKDGKLHLQQYNEDEMIPITEIDQLHNISVLDNTITMQQPLLHSSEITGRDLNTGEIVSLDAYMNKLQGRLKSPLETKSNQSYEKKTSRRNNPVQPGLSNLLNKRLVLGKMADGKRLVGKIVDIKKKHEAVESSKSKEIISPDLTLSTLSENSSSSTNVSEEPNVREIGDHKKQDSHISNNVDSLSEGTNITNKKKIVIQKKYVSRECFQHISGTLGGLMNMESVRKELQNKNILVKVIEKLYNPGKKTAEKSVSYCSGYMETQVTKDETGSVRFSWSFVPDSNTKQTLFGKLHSSKSQIFSGVINVTLLITYQKNKERVQVILDSDPEIKCTKCPKTFRTKYLLKGHLKNYHQIDDSSDVSEKYDTIYEIKREYSNQKKQCSTYQNVTKKSSTKPREQSSLECNICLKRFASLSALISHLAAHAGDRDNQTSAVIVDKVVQPKKSASANVYTCEICKKNFSRHSNLQRHVDIHKGQGNLYQCTICGCSYHYISSLTRHVVQYHIQRTEDGVKITNSSET